MPDGIGYPPDDPMLGAGLAGPAGAAPPLLPEGMGLPPGPPAPPPASLTSQPSGDPSGDAARQAIDIIKTALETETDDEDLVLLQKIMSDLQSYLAKQQKVSDRALGMGPGQKFLRRQTAMSGGGGAGF